MTDPCCRRLQANGFAWTEVPGTRGVARLVEGAVYDIRRMAEGG